MPLTSLPTARLAFRYEDCYERPLPLDKGEMIRSLARRKAMVSTIHSDQPWSMAEDGHVRLIPRPRQSALHASECSGLLSVKAWFITLVALGVLWRTVRYLCQFPIWGDEAFVCLNLLDRGYRELIQPLRFDQIARFCSCG